MGYALKLGNVSFADVALDQITYVCTVPCTGLALNTDTLTFEKVGDTAQLTATKTPNNTTDILTWSSSNENVATIDFTGLVTIHGIGTATITATCGQQTATALITQTTIKAQYDIKTLSGKYPYKYTVGDNAVIRLSAGANETGIGQAYHEGNNDLRIDAGYANDIECVRVPYGATTVFIKTSDDVEVTLSYLYVESTTETVTYNSNDIAKWLRTKEFFKTNTGYTVAYGECFVIRSGSNKDISTLSYIYFT